MTFEIEISSPDAKNDIYELRNYLQSQIEDLEVHIREQQPTEGQMSIGVVAGFILECVLHVATTVSIEELYERKLKPKIKTWVSTLKPKESMSASQTYIDTTLKENDSRVSFREEDNGQSKIFNNIYYAIDTEKTFAVLIGVSEFNYGFPSIPPIQGNLKDLFDVLTDKAHVGLPATNVLVALNKSNTEIEELLLTSSRTSGMQTYIVYFAGHGYRSDSKKLYLIATNTRRINDYIVGGIDFDFISNAVINASTASQKILLMDACHSGIATQGVDDPILQAEVKGTYTLASSPSDEASYFIKDARNTSFTSEVIKVLKDGVDNGGEMIALNDIYDYCRSELINKNLPEPHFKNKLNIPASSFYIAHNAKFSVDVLKSNARQLMKDGKFDEALYEYKILLKRFPTNIELSKEASLCETEVLYTRLIEGGDELYYKRDFQRAIDKYNKALKLKDDSYTRAKINNCNKNLSKDGKPNIINTTEKKTEHIEEPVTLDNIEQKPDIDITSSTNKTTHLKIVKPVAIITACLIMPFIIWGLIILFKPSSYSSHSEINDTSTQLVQPDTTLQDSPSKENSFKTVKQKPDLINSTNKKTRLTSPNANVTTSGNNLKQSKQVTEFKDADGDGIVDQLDMEPNTPAGCPVDSHGVALDTDGDGIPDCRDKEKLTNQNCFPVNSNGVGSCPEPEMKKDSIRSSKSTPPRLQD